MNRFIIILVISAFFWSCAEKSSKEAFDPEQNYSGEELAKIYCGSCHAYPEPALLSRKIWERNVLPLMGQKLGIIDFNYAMRNGIKLENEISISDSNWQKLRTFYLENAVEGRKTDERKYPLTSTFKVRVPESLPVPPLTTELQFTPRQDEFFLSSNRTLYLVNAADFQLKDSLLLPSPVTHIIRNNDRLEVLCVGNIHPNDQKEGRLLEVNLETAEVTELIDSLRRPVFFASVDLNQDGMEEKVVCEFGNNQGELSLFVPQKESFEKKVLASSPGARKVVAYDFDKNGFIDLMVQFCQGDERISIFYNDHLEFREEVVARFPPVYGSSTFDTLDFNGDGKLDFYAVFGDNADYSIMLKEYHGVRLFENTGSNKFRESHFIPVYGATDARADDYDLDGDTDIAVLAHFADYRTTPQNSFVYLENKHGAYSPSIVEPLPVGKWLTMEKADPDKDGDQDLFLGSFMLQLPNFSPTNQMPVLPSFIQLENLSQKKLQ